MAACIISARLDRAKFVFAKMFILRGLWNILYPYIFINTRRDKSKNSLTFTTFIKIYFTTDVQKFGIVTFYHG